MTIHHSTDHQFSQDVLNASELVLVDFYAEWCGPCKMISPVLEEISKEMETLKIVKLNIDDNPDIPTQYGVRSIPTLILFKNGQAVSTKVGLVPKNKLVEWIQESL